MNISENQNRIFPKGEKTPADYFTGTAWLNVLVPKDETGNYSIGNVEFEPGCRNNWHTHPAGQVLLVTNGKGFYQEKGKPARALAIGDVVVIPSKVGRLTHIAITNITAKGPVEWLGPVTDQEYNSCHEAK